ncbi:hypothetical protein EKN56_14900 [Limnobaculum zhutongyuii]|uniref:Uncharacterized protein n=1 Tax=Limnobaculum zhutongyuii TaxID=2498113 RepID=A0A411WNC8_9GAMM|nr:hypothetical protein [Limnobaculum zhutongyuii]QBH97575.1 hypothetical protein EKN56_14900 [Limnobaculum zhutongyuii]TQS91050.1 hypothetical protein ELQ32_01620 [Limnobaculum zhutongyuii]
MKKITDSLRDRHIGKIILSTRNYIRLSILLISITIISFGANYALLVQYAFMPEDVTNPAVYRFMESDLFKSNTKTIFKELEDFNNGVHGASYPKDIYLKFPSSFGLNINWHYKISPINNFNNNKLKYDSFISVKLNNNILILFILIESILFILLVYLILNKKSEPEIEYENKRIEEYLKGENYHIENYHYDAIKIVTDIFHGFNRFYLQLNQRYNNRASLVIKDEYDVQDIFNALLKLHFNDVRAEEYTPSHAGSSSRIDFLLNDEKIAIEIKMTRNGLKDAELGGQMLIDINRYSSHDKCNFLFFFIYDPNFLIKEPEALCADIKSKHKNVKVFISPLNIS